MKIYKLTQEVNTGYDTYDSCIVCAENEEEAKRIHPTTYMEGVYYDDTLKKFMNTYSGGNEIGKPYIFEEGYGAWTNDLSKIKCEEIGIANENIKKGSLVNSFNAG